MISLAFAIALHTLFSCDVSCNADVTLFRLLYMNDIMTTLLLQSYAAVKEAKVDRRDAWSQVIKTASILF